MNNFTKPFLCTFCALFVSLCFLFACSSDSASGSSNSEEIEIAQIPDTLDVSKENLGLENSIVIKFNGGAVPEISNPYESEVQISAEGERITVNALPTNTEYNFVISGKTSNGSLKIYGEYKIGLYLNGVDITNPSNPAINIQNGKKISVNLVKGTKNYLADGANYQNNGIEDAKGTLFSEGQLIFFGSGILEVSAKHGHAIATDDYFEMNYGGIVVRESAKDGIRANDYVEINDGVLNINIASDGGRGIRSEGYTKISGGTINIKTSGGKRVDNTVSPPDTNSAAGIKTDFDLEIIDGDITISSTGKSGKGINTNGNSLISGGSVKIDAYNDGIKTDGDLTIEGGVVNVKSKTKTAIDCKGNYNKIGGAVTLTDGGDGASGF